MKFLWSLLLACVVTVSAHATEPKVVVFFGDSLTAGLGLDDPATQAYPALIQQKIAAATLPWHVVNAGLSGETTAGGVRRIDWILRRPIDFLVLALGANDGLRGLPPAEIRRNLQTIIDKTRAKNPSVRVLIVGMKMPANMGTYATEFAAVFPALAEFNHAPLVPFLLEGVGGRAEFNQPDGIHPTAVGNGMMAAIVWPTLAPLLR
jgi:acyl-CoA thioesterase I